MASFNILKNSIMAAIKENGNEEITGQLLQDILIAMVNTLGLGYEYIGVATLTTNPRTPDTNVFYIAATAGTYANFGGLALSEGEVAILKYNGTWSKDSTGIASLEKVTDIETEINNIVDALALKADKNGSLSEIFNAQSIILPTTGAGSGTSQIVGATSPVPGRYRLPNSSSGGQIYTLATTEMMNQKADKDTDAVEGNLAEFDANGNPVDSGIPSTKIGEIEDKVTELGNSARISEGIADSISAGTPQEIVSRKSGGDGVNYIKRFKGRTLAWNVITNNSSTPSSLDGFTYSAGTHNSIIMNGSGSTSRNGWLGLSENSFIQGHKYYVRVYEFGGTGTLMYKFDIRDIVVGTGYIIQINSITPSSRFEFVANGTVSNKEFTCLCVDLTLMFGAGNEPSTVEEFEAMFPEAYYPYNAGTLISNDASALETVGFNQWDEEWEYGSINDGPDDTVIYVDANNAIRSKNFIPVSPNTTYFVNNRFTKYVQIVFFDANQRKISWCSEVRDDPFAFTTPAGCAFIKFRTNQDPDFSKVSVFCINLSDASRNGQYEPYWKRRIEVNLSTLKDKDGNLVFPYGGMHGTGTAFDSMKPEADGFIHYANRVFAIVDLSDPSLQWGTGGTEQQLWYVTIRHKQSNNAICPGYDLQMSGSANNLLSGQFNTRDSNTVIYFGLRTDPKPTGYLIYEIATPVVSELAEPIPNAILVDVLGTEQAIFPEHEDGSPSAPLCTDSNYSISVKNLVSKLANI